MKKQKAKLNEVTLRRLREAFAEHPARETDDILFKTPVADSPPPAWRGTPLTSSESDGPLTFLAEEEEGALSQPAVLDAVREDQSELSRLDEPAAETKHDEAASDYSSPDLAVAARAAGQVAAEPSEIEELERLGKLLTLISDRIPASPTGTTIRLSAQRAGATTKWFWVQAMQLDSESPLGRPVNVPLKLTVSLDQEIEPLAEDLAATIIARLEGPAAAATERGAQPLDLPPSLLSTPDPDQSDAEPPGLPELPSPMPAVFPAAAPVTSAPRPRPRVRRRRLLLAGVAASIVVLAAFIVMGLAARGHIAGPTDGIASYSELTLSSPPTLPAPDIVAPAILSLGTIAERLGLGPSPEPPSRAGPIEPASRNAAH
jgi:hypothetical protein